jgi:hypothetical protein
VRYAFAPIFDLIIPTIATVATEGIEIFKPNQLTIGLNLEDRTSRHCILNEAGEIIL